jgi:hypothetical protein
MRRQSEFEFIRQQGFEVVVPDHRLYVALMFQPRTIACLIAVGIALQSAGLFLAMSAVLWWGTVFPTRNLFDAVYNRLVAKPRGLPRIPIAPAPRRFAQAMAATVALVIGTAVLAEAWPIAWVFEGLFTIAVASVVAGRLCAPASVYLRFIRPSHHGSKGLATYSNLRRFSVNTEEQLK